MRRSSRLVAGVGLWLLALGCGHRLDNGSYRLTADSIDVDGCALAPSDGGLWSGALTVSGEDVSLDYALEGVPAQVRLLGLFKAPEFGQPDGFLADGTGAHLPVLVNPGPCTSDTTQIHLDASIDDPTHFQGLLRVGYTLTPSSEPHSPCTKSACQLVARFHAAPL